MYCCKCGKQIDDGSSFCNFCGAPISDVNNPQKVGETNNKKPVLDSPKKKRRTGLIIFLCLVVVCAVLIGNYVKNYKTACVLADDTQGTSAKNLNLNLGITNIHDPFLTHYIDAACYFEEEKYALAAEIYQNLAKNSYRESDTLYKESVLLEIFQIVDVEQGTLNSDISKLSRAINLLNKLKASGYAKEYETDITSAILVHMANAYTDDKFDFVQKAYYMINLKCLEKEDAELADVLYWLSRAEKTSSYSDEIYNKLIEYLEYDEAKEIILKKSFFLRKYLSYSWKDSSTKKYFSWGTDYVTDDFPCMLNAKTFYYHLDNGGIYVYKESDDSKNAIIDKEIVIIDENTMQLYCYKDRKTYILYRQYG